MTSCIYCVNYITCRNLVVRDSDLDLCSDYMPADIITLIQNNVEVIKNSVLENDTEEVT